MKKLDAIRFGLLVLSLGLSFNTVVIGQKPTTPNAAGGGNGNNVVAHDGSLTGNGIAGSPLGVATGGIGAPHLSDGAVTAQKLGTTNTPQTGQVLAFTASGLTWQTPAVSSNGPLRIVDSLGSEVGVVAGGSDLTGYEVKILRFIPSENVYVHFNVSTAGVVDYALPLYYESSDCTGTPFLLEKDPLRFNQTALRFGSDLYYPTGTNQTRTIKSQKQDGQCFAAIFTADLASLATIPVSTLGTPPFRLAR